jgi:F420-non-reducing hydrogenase iron-sulfur subunit
MRLSYPASIRIVKMPCSGRVDTTHILKAFENGADGICIVGCLEGDCHFITGNIRAKKRVEHARHLLEEAGMEPERLQMYNLSAADGRRFAQVMREMAERIAALGPSMIRKTGRLPLESGALDT